MKPLSLRYALMGIFLLGVLYIGGMGSYFAFSSVTSTQAALQEAEELSVDFEGSRVLLDRLEAVVSSSRRHRDLTLLWAAIGTLLIAASLYWFRARIYGPLREVERGLTRVGAGRYDQPVPVARADELGRLAEILNWATSSLKERTEAQARETRTLQERVGRLMEDSAREIYIFHAEDFHLVQMNDTLRGELLWEEKELAGLSPFDFLSQPHGDELRRGLARLKAGEISVLPFAVHHVREDGTRYPVEGHIQFSGDEDPPVMLAVARDMTEIYDREDRLRQAMKMQAVGQLTGGVAHDFNNLLTVISASLDLMEEPLPPDDPQLGLLRDAMAAAERGGALTHQLLAFSRKQALRPQTLDLNQLLSDWDRVLRRTIGEDVEIELIRGAGLWRCHADPTEVQNVVLNLCLNARDAMPSGGKLTIETGNARLDDGYAVANADVRPGQYVMVVVTDTGTGMSPDVLARAFEPFFSTKGVGKGSGLGLSMAYGFAKQSGGHLKLLSEEGKGTEVRFYLPGLLAEQMDLGMEDHASSRKRPGGAGEKILVVEDDPAVLETAILALESLGYRTESATTVDEAFTILTDEPPGTYGLLFTDVVLPKGKTGRDLAQQARAYDAGLPVLFTSGYTQDAIIRDGRLDPGVHLLEKPYRIEHLARKVRELLR